MAEAEVTIARTGAALEAPAIPAQQAVDATRAEIGLADAAYAAHQQELTNARALAARAGAERDRVRTAMDLGRGLCEERQRLAAGLDRAAAEKPRDRVRGEERLRRSRLGGAVRLEEAGS